MSTTQIGTMVMADENVLQHKQFFHGTASKLEPGDLIHPNHLGDVGYNKQHPEHSDFVWMTSRPSDADWFARHRGAMAKQVKHTDQTANEASHVYEVEPTGLHAPADIPPSRGDRKLPRPKSSTAHVSLAPARVVREVPQEERREIRRRKLNGEKI